MNEEVSIHYISWDYDQGMTPYVGNKAARLGELKKMGIKIPPGFVVTKKAFLDFLVDNEIYNQIESQLQHIPADIQGIRSRSDMICNSFTDAEIPNKMAGDIAEAYNLLAGEVLVAVRSSSIIEDLSQASFAGLYETFLNLKSVAEVKRAVKRCWQSSFNVKVLAYLKRLEIKVKDLSEIAMGVLVQQMINPEFAGVMFTIDPITGDASKIAIEYTHGQGDMVVSGETTPNLLLIDKITNKIDRAAGDNILEKGYCLPVCQLTELAKRIEKEFGCYQDIEWAIDRDSGEVVILQARPESVWNIRHQKPFHQDGQTVFNFIPEVRI